MFFHSHSSSQLCYAHYSHLKNFEKNTDTLHCTNKLNQNLQGMEPNSIVFMNSPSKSKVQLDLKILVYSRYLNTFQDYTIVNCPFLCHCGLLSVFSYIMKKIRLLCVHQDEVTWPFSFCYNLPTPKTLLSFILIYSLHCHYKLKLWSF